MKNKDINKTENAARTDDVNAAKTAAVTAESGTNETEENVGSGIGQAEKPQDGKGADGIAAAVSESARAAVVKIKKNAARQRKMTAVMIAEGAVAVAGGIAIVIYASAALGSVLLILGVAVVFAAVFTHVKTMKKLNKLLDEAEGFIMTDAPTTDNNEENEESENQQNEQPGNK